MPSATTSCDVNVGRPFFLGVRPLHNWCESGGTPCPTPGFENRRMALGGYLLPHPPSSPMRDAVFPSWTPHFLKTFRGPGGICSDYAGTPDWQGFPRQ